MLGKVGVVLQNDFTITNSNRVLVPGVSIGTITSHLFDPTGTEISSTIPVTITELGFGHYRASFTPNSIGVWYLVTYHNIYFPWGKGGNCQIFANDFDTIQATVVRILGLTQENFYIDMVVNDTDGNMLSSRIRTYTNSTSVGTDNDILSEYNVNATYTNNLMDSYKVTKI